MPYWFDGNNIIGLSSAAVRGAGKRRQEFLLYLSSLLAGRSGRFLVFFDGDDTERSRPPRGILVRFSAPLSADDDIVRHLEGRSHPGEIIVVTNDRELALRCTGAGSGTRTWSEFERRAARHRPTPAGNRMVQKPEQAVDVGEWLDFFGLEDENLPD